MELIQLTSTDVEKYGLKQMKREYNKPLTTNNQAVPLEVYKTMLADWVLNGKVKKIPAKHKNAIRFPEVGAEQLQNTVEALVSLGFDRKTAVSKVDIALEQGLRHEHEIIQSILTL